MKIKNQLVQVLLCTTITIVILLSGCTPNSKQNTQSVISPDGVFAQLVRIDAGNNSENFKTLMTHLVQVADSVDLANPYHWICYQEAPNFFWLLTISDSIDNFVHPGSIEGFASSISQYAKPSEREKINALGESLKELPVTKNITQQYSKWSTTNNVESRDFPMSRVVIYHFKEKDLLAFNENMVELSNFLSTNNITFQVEGFIAYPRTMNTAWQVIFLPENSSFNNAHVHYDFSAELNKEKLDNLTKIQEKIKSNINGMEYFDGIRIDSLSFGTH